MILVGLLTGVLFLTGCAKTKKNVSKGYSDSTKDSAVCFEEQVREKYDDLVKYLGLV